MDIAATSLMQRDKLPKSEDGRAWLSDTCLKALKHISTVGINSADSQVQKISNSKLVKFNDINMDAYAYGCEVNTKRNKRKNEVALLNSDDMERGCIGVSEAVASFIDTNIDEILDSSEVKTLVNDFIYKHDEVLMATGLDLWSIMESAKKAEAKMIDKLRELVVQFDMIELIEGVLSNSSCMTELKILFNGNTSTC